MSVVLQPNPLEIITNSLGMKLVLNSGKQVHDGQLAE